MEKQRKIIIFGNGLGMALDKDFFHLDNAIGWVWNEDILDDTAKKLILRCLPDKELDRPHGEDELDKLHLSMSACEFLLGLGDADYHWLSDTGKTFPAAVKTFIYKTAEIFHDSKLSLPDHFLDSLEKFLREARSHVATLNYDNVLYLPMAQRQICYGYDSALVDGFTDGTGFLDENMDRHPGKNFGYYLHLHGSPRFVDRGSKIIKLKKTELKEVGIATSNHIVLTHIAHKRTVIDASRLLTAYWNRLAKAIDESKEIILIGYSGKDIHLNQHVKNSSEKLVRVVEWQGSGSSAERERYWRHGTPGEPGGAIGPNVSVTPVKSILDFQDW